MQSNLPLHRCTAAPLHRCTAAPLHRCTQINKPRLTATSAVFILALSLAACGGGGGGGGGGGSSGGSSGGGGVTPAPADTTPPVLTAPAGTPVTVAPTGQITVATANEALGVVNLQSTVVVKDGTTVLSGTVALSSDNRTMTWTPNPSLPYNTTVSFTATPSDTAGNAAATLSYSAVVSTPTITPTLFAEASTASLNGGSQFSLLSLTSGTTAGGIPAGLVLGSADSCYGQALNPKTLEVNLSCRFGTNAYAVYDMVSRTVKAGPTLAAQTTGYSPVVYGADGTGYYGFGQTTPSSGSDGRIVVVKNKAVTKTVGTPTASRSANTTPQRLKIANGKVFVMERGPSGVAGRIDIFDITSETFDALSIAIPTEAFDMQVSSGIIAVSVSRGADGKDVIFYNASTGVRIGDIALAGGLTNQFNAFGIVLFGNNLYIANIAGVRLYALTVGANTSSVTATTGALFTTSSFTYELAYSAKLNKLYATMPNNIIFKINPVTMTQINIWTTIVTGGGTLYVAE